MRLLLKVWRFPLIKYRTFFNDPKDKKWFDEIKKDKESTLYTKLKELYDSICQSPYYGIGRPHPLRENRSGWWSRHISGLFTVVYVVDKKQNAIVVNELHVDYHNKASATSDLWDDQLDDAFYL